MAEPRCNARVWKRDTYRYSGNGKSGFTLRYKQCQCERHAISGSQFCTQHAKMARTDRYPVLWSLPDA